jgi:hypothetical protein
MRDAKIRALPISAKVFENNFAKTCKMLHFGTPYIYVRFARFAIQDSLLLPPNKAVIAGIYIRKEALPE